MVRFRAMKRSSAALLMAAFFLLLASPLFAATTLVVTNCADSGAGSLRQALADSGQGDTIAFDIALADAGYSTGETGPGLVTAEASGRSWFRIIVNSTLTVNTSEVSILGSTQTREAGNEAAPRVEVRSSNNFDVFSVAVNAVTVEGLAINRGGGSSFTGNGIVFNGSYSQVLNCVIGLSATGEGAAPKKLNYGIQLNVPGLNRVGNGTAGGRNVISGCNNGGIWINSSSNEVKGNYLGTNLTGEVAIANKFGVYQTAGQRNIVGGTGESERNIISGNTNQGLRIGGADVFYNQYLGNYIGLSASGTKKLNNTNGIDIMTGSYNIIGGTTAGARNIISGNDIGVALEVSSATSNEVKGNYIGTDPSGSVKMANTTGVRFFNSAKSNVVGGSTEAERNVISGNNTGVNFDTGAESNILRGNYIGLNAAGNSPLGNSNGIIINVARFNLIGGTQAGEGNIISGNTGYGVYLIGTNTNSNEVLGNYIGTGPDGTSEAKNGSNGIYIYSDPSYNLIGPANIIAYNGASSSYAGVNIEGGSTRFNRITQNSIFANDPAGIRLLNGGNGSVASPEIAAAVQQQGATTTEISGTAAAAPGGTVELFKAQAGQGKTYLGSATVEAGGAWQTVVTGLSQGDTVVATATTITAETSAFSQFQTVVRNVPGVVLNCNDSGLGSLRAVLAATGPDGQVLFDLTTTEAGYSTGEAYPGLVTNEASGRSWYRIIVNSTLPTVQYDGIFVRGSTQTGEASNGNCPNVEVRANGTFNVIEVTASLVTLEGLTVNRRGGSNGGSGIYLNGADNTSINGCLVGPTATGEGAAPSLSTYGIRLANGASGNRIGNGTAAGRNVISGNADSGIYLDGSGCGANQIKGNYLGTGASGLTALKNNNNGIWIANGASGNLIGGSAAGDRNIISGNQVSGVSLTAANTLSNEVQGNYIGLNASGEAALPNNYGVQLVSAANNLIGGSSTTEANVISGNTTYGLELNSAANNNVKSNFIGTTASGESPAPNGIGINLASGATGNVIGGTLEGERNIISGNSASGIAVGGNAASNEVIGNYIGLNKAGNAALANNYGIVISSAASNNLIGRPEPGAGNVISGNSNYGVRITNNNTRANKVKGNYIGTDPAGSTAIKNSQGVRIDGLAGDNSIGGVGAGERNIISGNDVGVMIDGVGTNEVKGNIIGLDPSGEAAVANVIGIMINNAQNNLIGGSTPADANVISGNSSFGLYLTAASGNEIKGNLIGTAPSGESASGNLVGIKIFSGSARNLIGGSLAGERNVISGNIASGITIAGSGTNSNEVAGNYIGLSQSGNNALGNAIGISIESAAAGNVIGGTTADKKNVISGNLTDGIRISGANGNEIKANYLGTRADGVTALKNDHFGVAIGGASVGNIIGPANIIANNGQASYPAGLKIEGSASRLNSITQNSLYANYGDGILLTAGANDAVATPEIFRADYNQPTGRLWITGAAAANARIEIFRAELNQGKTYLGFVTANGSGVIHDSFAYSGSGEGVIATQTDTLGNTSMFSQTREVVVNNFIYRPDLIIGTLESGADYVGEGIFNSDGSGQTRITSSSTGESAVYYIKIKNAGNTSDEAIITGPAGSGDWAATYYDAKTGGNNITAQITSSGWPTVSLGSAETKELRVVVQNSGTALATFEGLITSTSSGDGITVDAVKFSATAIPLAPVTGQVDHFEVSVPAAAVAGTAFSATITAKQADGTTQQTVTGATALTVDDGTIAPTAIAPTDFSLGVWSGNLILSKLGARKVTVSNGSANGTAEITVTNATKEYTSADLGVPGLTVNIPSGATSLEVTVTAGVVTAPGAAPAGFSVGGTIVDLLPSGTTFLVPVTVTIPISGPLADPRVYYWTGTAWSAAGITIVSVSATSITFTTTHFTTFAPLAALPTNLVRFGPNPYNPANGNAHFWYWLDANADTSIYVADLSGSLVWKQSYASGTNGGMVGANNITFDGKSAWGDTLGNGAYLYKIIQGGKSIGGGKIAIIK